MDFGASLDSSWRDILVIHHMVQDFELGLRKMELEDRINRYYSKIEFEINVGEISVSIERDKIFYINFLFRKKRVSLSVC